MRISPGSFFSALLQRRTLVDATTNTRTRLLFDHLTGARQQCRGNAEAERLGGLEIDNQFVLGRRLHRQVSRLFAPKDAINVASSAPVLVNVVRPIRGKTAAGDPEA